MKKLLVFQHVPFEILGSLNPLLKEAGFRIRYVNFGRHPDARPELDGYSGLVILGGPMSAYEVEHEHLATEVGLIRTALEKGPAGAWDLPRSPAHRQGPRGQGKDQQGARDRLVRCFPHRGGKKRPSLLALQRHRDAVSMARRHHPHPAEGSPSGSPDCRNQAFRFGDRVYGFQFHLEVDEPLIERWLNVPVHKAELKNLQPRVTPERIRQETPRNIQRLRSLSEKTFGGFVRRFVRLLGAPRRTVLLRSR